MTPITIGILAVSMSVDAFVACLGKGAAQRPVGLGPALRTGAIFGAVEAITPLIGWGAGVAANRYVEAVDHWIAFALLSAVGLHMLFQALSRDSEAAPAPSSLWRTLLTAVGTSIDAMAVGVSLAFLQVNILVIAIIIGLTTMTLSTSGLLAGRLLGRRFGRIAEMLGGVALIGLGGSILLRHLGAA